MGQICEYASERITVSELQLDDYVSTDNLLQNLRGLERYEGEPNISSVIKFQKGDILLSNIRPYLKKMWLADRNGGCNPDVLAIRVNNDEYMPELVYYILGRQQFFDYVMTNVKGMKMPRGNKDHIMRYNIPVVSIAEQQIAVEQAKQCEQLITQATDVMEGCASRKRAILNKYLNASES